MASRQLKRKRKRDKAKRKKKFSLTSKIAGLVVGGAILAYPLGIRYNQSNQPISVSETQKISDRKTIDQYIDQTIQYGSDPDKRNLYFIFQKHVAANEYDKIVDEVYRQTATDNTITAQIAVYRILENLYKNKDLGVIANEGYSVQNKDDINNPNALTDSRNILIHSIESSDKILEEFISIGSAYAIGLLYSNLFLVGYEEEETSDRLAEIIKETRELFEQNKDRLVVIETNEFIEINRKRSFDAIKYALQNSDKLFEQGLIKNKDVAIIIGYGHIKDYKKIFEDSEKGLNSYNSIVIIPNGVKD